MSDKDMKFIMRSWQEFYANDTATLTAQVAVSGSINTTDSNDIAIIMPL